MLKYIGWVIRVIIPLIRYYPMIFRMSNHPERYPFDVRYNKVRTIALLLLRILKVDINMMAAPQVKKGTRFYLIGNHVSFLDPVIVVATQKEPITFASKIEAAKFPIVGRILRMIDAVFLERGNLKQEITAMKTMKASMNEGRVNWGLFPEGTRNQSYNNDLLEFKAGSFKLPCVTDTVILPVAIWGTQTILTKKIWWKRYPTYIKYLPIITPKDFDYNTKRIADFSQNLIQTEVNIMKLEYPKLVASLSKGEDFATKLSK